MNRTLRSTLCATAIGLLALTGCSSQTEGEGTAADTATETPPTSQIDGSPDDTSTSEAERAVEDLDPGRATEDPCLFVTPDQLTAYGLTEPGEAEVSPVDDILECSWSNRQNESINRLIVAHDQVTGGIERLREAPFPYVETDVEIAGRPAIHHDTLPHEPEGQCGTYVDLTADSTLSVRIYISDDDVDAYSNPCGKVDEVAAMIIENIQGGI
ncbi:hypothetical protein FHR81_001394 [Actinoalloteichus hoggarensis]|uniref:Uncharacterized protein n=1 Tax=Actinoalloteichus hoggarensis TaxID=1470176 RepID=A0A221W063_9PSEU|nr:DUF3558 domain-containing protein [Actinoalloteichus hoggarensis]ASO19128.1 hypothetical protein AHOG_07405 [Actinoalloteichus hoggarensis]MBB5920364.1 hypothetical protein [Actinoalloteichus hoggarensis]